MIYKDCSTPEYFTVDERSPLNVYGDMLSSVRLNCNFHCKTACKLKHGSLSVKMLKTDTQSSCCGLIFIQCCQLDCIALQTLDYLCKLDGKFQKNKLELFEDIATELFVDGFIELEQRRCRPLVE